MPDMNDLQWTLVADRISDLGRERDAIRAETARDHPTSDSEAGEAGMPAHDETRRVRFGHWLMTLGARIAGPRRIDDEPVRMSSRAAAPDPCGDGDRLAPAA
jgi:hypothetical protein